jgi:hypothetical protein
MVGRVTADYHQLCLCGALDTSAGQFMRSHVELRPKQFAAKLRQVLLEIHLMRQQAANSLEGISGSAATKAFQQPYPAYPRVTPRTEIVQPLPRLKALRAVAGLLRRL